VTHNENLRVSVVLNEFEVITGLPVVLFLVNKNVLEILLGKLDHTGITLHMMLNVGHGEMIKNFNLIKLIG